MEDTLGVTLMLTIRETISRVLILVLMEDTLGDVIESLIKAGAKVLILVLMEDTLGESSGRRNEKPIKSLNSCFNGRYSRRAKTYISLFIAV